ncbi:phytanoyl-CoA dioxygenase family protein [Jannaschia sp. W003]|uniref:phytanoyl-CoA dioxygenase family protein n=1 Tax=Jannaschia sp. W003 TaxID=2867012 RepID=UPI0021A63148|nr:phytanoyl-CoA dioxygenase family protein [Jannaschia sp. W003]UWQ21543.1 phytanoyl-CoA dioxygenase family protein [Jannaschia sp. W003]
MRDHPDAAARLRALLRETAAEDAPRAARIERGVPVYDCAALAGDLADPEGRAALMAEWAHVLGEGPGALALAGAVEDLGALDAATAAYGRIIDAERGRGGADHFAAAGANDRVWNAAQKLCLAEPETFARVFGCMPVAAVCEAWLGPAYQMTAQINVVRPGGAAQRPHRDYHLGFMPEAEARRFPAHAHALSPALTLQGAIAHVDMPVESGPTKLLPWSQHLEGGYLAMHHDDVAAVFEEAHVQVPLRRGDALFFSPALLHAGGANRTADVERMANLLQVSSCMGRAMEAVDRAAMCRALYPALLDLADDLGPTRTEAAVAACAEGYAFPTNLDRDPPAGGLAPPSQADVMRAALAKRLDPAAFAERLDAHAARRQP